MSDLFKMPYFKVACSWCSAYLLSTRRPVVYDIGRRELVWSVVDRAACEEFSHLLYTDPDLVPRLQ